MFPRVWRGKGVWGTLPFPTSTEHTYLLSQRLPTVLTRCLSCLMLCVTCTPLVQFIRTGDEEAPIELEFNDHPPPPPPPFLVSPLVQTVKAYSSASFDVTFAPPDNLEAFKAVMVADAAWMFPDEPEVSLLSVICGYILWRDRLVAYLRL